MMSFLGWLVRLPLRCRHRAESWPRRGTDGKDYVVCLDCGHRRLSPIQFGVRT